MMGAPERRRILRISRLFSPTLVAAMVSAGAGELGCRRSPFDATDAMVAGADAAASDAQNTATVAVDAGLPPDDTTEPTSGEELQTRARHLLEAIAKDDATLATDILFPRDGFLATRDSANPGAEWEKRVAAPFRRAVHALSRRRGAALAQFVSFELGPAIEQQTPRRHKWKKPLWTAHAARLTFTVDGKTRTLTIRELTAWRGAWYVTRLR